MVAGLPRPYVARPMRVIRRDAVEHHRGGPGPRTAPAVAGRPGPVTPDRGTRSPPDRRGSARRGSGTDRTCAMSPGFNRALYLLSYRAIWPTPRPSPRVVGPRYSGPFRPGRHLGREPPRRRPAPLVLAPGFEPGTFGASRSPGAPEGAGRIAPLLWAAGATRGWKARPDFHRGLLGPTTAAAYAVWSAVLPRALVVELRAGAPGGSRTPGPRLRRAVLCSAELQARAVPCASGRDHPGASPTRRGPRIAGRVLRVGTGGLEPPIS
jgi:hypothetical protein